jgi:hypothetical protein
METFDASSAITHSANSFVTDALLGMCTAPASVQVNNFEIATSLEVASAPGEVLDEVITDGKAAFLQFYQTPREKNSKQSKNTKHIGFNFHLATTSKANSSNQSSDTTSKKRSSNTQRNKIDALAKQYMFYATFCMHC